MFERIKLLLRLSYSPSEGIIKLDDTRVFTAPISLLTHTRDKIRDIGPTGDRFLYEAGKEAGKEFAETLDDINDASDKSERMVRKASQFGSYTGWGSIEVYEMNMEDQEFRIKIENGFFDTESEEPTPYTSGMLAGAAELILKREMNVVKDKEKSTGEIEHYDMKPGEELQVSWSS